MSERVKISVCFKIACRVQIWKKNILSKCDKFGYSFIKNDIMFMYLLCVYKTPIILKELELVYDALFMCGHYFVQ